MSTLALLDPLEREPRPKVWRKTRHLVIGQDEAIHQIVRAYQTYLRDFPRRPADRKLLVPGPHWFGEDTYSRGHGGGLVGNPRAVIKIDCAEFQHSHEIAKLIGSPPGYLGHRETHPLLSQEALNQHHTESVKLSFLLFDEIEKASDALWNLLLGILDKATLTLGDNRKVDFSGALIFLTSNIGAAEMSSLVSPKLGFQFSVAQGRERFRPKTQSSAFARRCRCSPSEVHAGVHQSVGQDRRLQGLGR